MAGVFPAPTPMAGFPDEYARHIPLYILQQGLSEELLEAWNIK